MTACLTSSKIGNRKVKNELVGNDEGVNSVFEQCCYSRTAKSNIKIGNNSIKLMKWMHNLIDILKK